MSAYQVTPTFAEHSVFGGVPGLWVGEDTPDGDAAPWSLAPQGSEYKRIVTDNQTELYEKVKNDGRNDDWVLREGTFSQRVTYDDLTDGGGATGTEVLNVTIPAGAYYITTLVTDVDDWVGSTTVTWTLGDGTDADRYNTGTPSFAADADYLSAGVPSGTLLHSAAIATVTLTVTDDSDYGDISAGAATFTGFYRGAKIG